MKALLILPVLVLFAGCDAKDTERLTGVKMEEPTPVPTPAPPPTPKPTPKPGEWMWKDRDNPLSKPAKR